MNNPLIEIDRLGKKYATGRVALDDVSLAIDEGESWRCSAPTAPARRR